MNKNRSVWSVLLSVVLAMVVMAGLAVISFAEIETDPAALEAVLNGTQKPAEGVDYDVDGNGIVEWDDLAAFDGTQEDLLPNGETDLISWPLDEEWTEPAERDVLQSLFVRGDSTVAIKYDRADQNQLLDWADPYVDFSNSSALVFDLFWPDEAGSLKLTIFGDDLTGYERPVPVTGKGWSTVVIDLTDLPADNLTMVSGVYFDRAVSGESQVVYIDNMYLTSGTRVDFSSEYGDIASKQVVTGAAYGELPAPAHNFFRFEGWYLDAGYTEEVTADTIVETEGEHTLYAKWSEVINDDGTISVTDKGDGDYGITTDGSYKQIRFQFKLYSGDLHISYADNDTTVSNNPVVTILDANGNAVSQSKVQPGQWYTAVIYGGSVVSESIVIQDGANMATSGTLSLGNAQMEIRQLETLGGQFGLRFLGRNEVWKMTDESAIVEGKRINGYNFYMDTTSLWDSRWGFEIPQGGYTKMTYEFYIYELGGAAANGQVTGLKFTTDSTASAKLPQPVIYDMNGNVVSSTDVKAGTWYRVEIDMTGVATTQYLYSAVTAGTYRAYITNVNFVQSGTMVDNLNPATTVTVNKTGGDGNFFTTPVTRDTDRGTYRVTADSADWAKRAIQLTLKDTTKELIQVDFRFVTSKDGSGKNVAPTLVATTNLSGTPKNAQYIIVDENDDPVKELEIGKWYRMFIQANGGTTFGIVPATTGEVELQLENLETFNTDELAASMTSAKGNMSIILTRLGKLEYAYVGSSETTLTITLNSHLYKRVSFNVKSDSAVSVEGASAQITGSGAWKTVVITNNGEAVSKTFTLHVGAGTLKIKDFVASLEAEAAQQKAESTLFRGLDADEMLISIFIGPREEEYFGYYNSDQKSNPTASLATDDVFKLLANAGINYISDQGVHYTGAEKEKTAQILRLAAKYGLQYYVTAHDVAQIGTVIGTEPVTGRNYNRNIYSNYVGSVADIKAKILELYQYDSFGGFYLRDEPTTDLFDDIKLAIDRINEAKTQLSDVLGENLVLNYYLNMYPNMGSTGGHDNFYTYKGSYTSWENYLKYGVSDTGMNHLSFDLYPFSTDGIASGFLNALADVANAAKSTNVLWQGFVQVGGGVPSYGSGTAIITESGIHWDVNTMLAFGAKGINYYIGVTPPHFDPSEEQMDPHSLIDFYGNPTVYYDYAKQINAQIQAMDHVLMNSTYKGVILNGTTDRACNYSSENSAVPLLNTNSERRGVKINSVSGTALIGAFDYNGQTALLVVNNTVEDNGADTITLNLTGMYSYEIIQDAKTSWASGQSLNITLLPGRCAMVIVHEGEVSAEVDVYFDLNYSGAPAYNETVKVSLTGGATYPALPVPANRAALVFDGWYADPDCTGEPVAEGQGVVNTVNHVLYAKWAIDKSNINYTIGYGSDVGSYYANASDAIFQGEFAYKIAINSRTDPTNDIDRRVHLKIADSQKQVVSMEIYFAECTNTPSIVVWRGDGLASNPAYAVDYIVTDAEGNVYDPHNLELNQWYTVTFLGVGIGDYMLRPFEGSCTHGTFYVRNVTVSDVTGAFASTYYVWAAPYAAGNDTHYLVCARYVNDPTEISNRNVTFNTSATAGDIISMKMQITKTSGTPDMYITNAAGSTMGISIVDENGNAVSATQMQLGQWYTVSWIADGSATYNIYSFAGTKANGAYIVKDIATSSVNINYTIDNGTAGNYYTTITKTLFEGEVVFKSVVNSKNDPTNSIVRRVHLKIADSARQAVSMKIYFAECTNTPSIVVWRGDGMAADTNYAVDYIVTDAAGNVYDPRNLELGKWYTVTFIGAGVGDYMLFPFEGSATNGTFYVKDVTTITNTDPIAASYYVTAAPYAAGEDTHYWLRARVTTDPTELVNRVVTLKTDAQAGKTISMKMQMTQTTGTPDLQIKNAAGSDMRISILDEDGNGVSATQMQMGQWYTVYWAADGSASYNIYTFQGTKATGTFFVKNITITDGAFSTYRLSFDLNYAGATNAPAAITVAAGGTYGALPTPTRENYVFAGWYTEAACTNKVSEDAIVPDSHTLYAKWNAKPNYAVVYHSGSFNNYYVTISEVTIDGDFAYKTVVNSRGDGTNDVDRRVHLQVTAGEKQVVSMKIFFESCTNTPSIVLWRADGMANNTAYATDYIVTDDAGNVYDPHNLETGKWYNVTFLAVGIGEYMLRPFEGSATNGTYYVKDVTVSSSTGAFTSQYYVWAAPYAAGDDTHYFIRARYTNDGTVIGNREIIFNTSAAAGDLISMKVQMTQTSGTPDMYIRNAGGTTMDISIIDDNGNAVSATQMQLGKWYTISWIADGSATYKFYTFQGEKANGSYLVKDITVTPAA